MIPRWIPQMIVAPLALVGLCLLTTPAEAQRGGGGGNRGGGGFNIRGLANMIGQPGGVPKTMLLNHPAIQEELGLSEEQKLALRELNQDTNQRRREVFEQARQQQRQFQQQARAFPGGPGPAGPAAGGGRGGDRGRGGRGGPPGGGGGPGGGGFGAAMNPAMQQAMTLLQRETETQLARILSPAQRKRLDEIALQIEGPLAVARPEIAQRLRMTPAQNEQVQAVVNGMRTTQRQTMANRFQALRNNPQGPGGGFGPPQGRLGGGPQPGAGGGPQQPGGGNNQQDRREQMRAQFEEVRQLSDQIRDEAVQQIGRILRSAQKQQFNRMLGEPFDLSLLEPQGRRNNRDDDQEEPLDFDDDDFDIDQEQPRNLAPQFRNLPTPTAPAPEDEVPARRPSLRELRGLDG